jgi:hypothetical protein
VSDVKKYLKEIFPEFYGHLATCLKTSNHYSSPTAVFWNTAYTAPSFQKNISGRKINHTNENPVHDLPHDLED